MVYPVKKKFRYSRHSGYEVSTIGDKRFSAFNAILPDGRSIEQHYQCDVKGYDVGGTDWRKGKGKQALDPAKDLYAEYLKLWRFWADSNYRLMEQLKEAAVSNDYTLRDSFANSPVNQARALAELLNEAYGEHI